MFNVWLSPEFETFVIAVIEPTSVNERSEYSPSRLSGRISASPAPPIEEVQENNHRNQIPTQPDTSQPNNNQSENNSKPPTEYSNQSDSAYSSTDKSDTKSDSFEEQPLGGIPRQYSQPELFWNLSDLNITKMTTTSEKDVVIIYEGGDFELVKYLSGKLCFPL